MRSDLAALIPPLVIAAAFIAGVVALLRREMAPRRRGAVTPPEEEQADLARGARGGAAPGYLQTPHAPRSGHQGDDGSADNSARRVVRASGNPDLPGRVDDAAIVSTPEDSPPAAPGS